MIDIDLLDQQLEAALSVELRAQLKPVVKAPEPAASATPAPARLALPADPDVWLVDDESWGTDPDPWPSHPDIWPGGADAWPAQPQPQPEPKPKPKPKPQPQRQPKPQPQRQPKPQPQPQVRVRPQPPAPPPRPPVATAPPAPKRASRPSAPPRSTTPRPAPKVEAKGEPKVVVRRQPLRRPRRQAPTGWTPPSVMPLSFEKTSTAPEPATEPVKQRPARPARPARPRPAGPRLAHADPAPATPVPSVPSHDTRGHADKVMELVGAGRIQEADLHIAAHARLAEEGTIADRLDAAAWAAMRALLDGRREDARRGTELVRQLGEQAGDPAAAERYLRQRFWLVLEWGSEDERFELLDLCRQRAYWQQDLGWRCALVLLLARMGRADEAARELDETVPRVLNSRVHDAEWTDMASNLAEAAALLSDPRRATALNRAVDWAKSGMVVVGRADVCKGATARFQALLSATTGGWADADRAFSAATDAHRRAGAQPLLARTLREWGRSLTGRDDLRARSFLQESTVLATELQLVELLPAS